MSNIRIILLTSAVLGALFAPSFSFASHGNAVQDFYISASPSGMREVGRTSQIQYVISLNSEGGFDESVSLKFNSAYSDLSGSFSRASIVPGQISTLTLSASGAATLGEYASGIEVVGTSNGLPSLVRKLPIQIRVTDATSTSPAPAITASLSATVNGIITSQVLRGAPVTVNWTSQNATVCQAISGAGFSTGGAVSGSINIPALTNGATFAIQCTGSGNTQNASITVNTFTHKLYVAAYEMENCAQNSAYPMGSDASYIRTSFFGPGGYISSEGSAYTRIPITIATTGDYVLQDAIFTNFFVGQDYHFCDAEGVPANFNSLIFPQERTISLFYQNLYFGEDDGASDNGGGQTNNESYSVPAVNTQTASFIYQNSALLNGAVNPQGAVTSAWFEYGTSPSLGSTTFAQPAGMGVNSILYSFALTGLSADTTYYYRAVASNKNGTVYGSILSFRTLGYVAPVIIVPPAPAPAPTPVPAPQPVVTVVQVAENPLACVDISTELDKQELLSDQEFNYILHIENSCSAILSNLSIVVTLPGEVSFVSTSYPFRKNNGVVTYNLGTLDKDTEASILIHAKTGSVKRGEIITFFSRANFLYQGKNYSVSSPLSVVIGAKNFFSANVLDFAGNILDYLLIVLIVVGVMFAWNFFKKNKKG